MRSSVRGVPDLEFAVTEIDQMERDILRLLR
jgi:hypothetical protein